MQPVSLFFVKTVFKIFLRIFGGLIWMHKKEGNALLISFL